MLLYLNYFMLSKGFKKLFNPLDLDLKPYNIRFRDKAIESAFYEDYQSKTVSFMLLYLVVGILIYGGFGLSNPNIHEVLVRFIIVLPSLIILTLAIYFKWIKKGLYVLLSFFVLILIESFMFLMVSAKDNYPNYLLYFSGLILIILSFNALFRLKLKQMLLINMVVLISFIMIDHYFCGIGRQYPYAFKFYVLEIFSACLIGWLASYNFEYLYRNDFYQSKIIRDQAEILQLANEQMEQKVIDRTHELEQVKQKSYKAILEGQQIERQRIAQDLHDSLSIRLINVKRKLENETGNNSLIGEIDGIIAQVREISHDLLPYSLKHFGLIKAINDMCLNLGNQHHFDVSFSKIGIDDNRRFDPIAETELYKIIQELQANIIKHARASKVLIELIADGNMLYLTVEDDGVGFTTSDHGHRFGLNNIEARLSVLGGTLSIDSQLGKGTTIMINIPIT
jgi:signal transduction histidine kinase